MSVQRVVDSKVQEYTVQEDVENSRQQECKVRFTLARSTPIMNTLLGKRLRYLCDKDLACTIITGTYEIPTDLDPATKLILEEISKLGVLLVNAGSTEIIITPKEVKTFWKQVGEFTSSLMSGICYGHYKADIQCKISTQVLAQQLTVVARSRLPQENWGVGLQLMLEKNAGVCLIDKL